MRQSTLNLLRELDQADWFSALGQPVDPTIVTVSGWPEALSTLTRHEWDDALLEAANQIRNQLVVRHSARYQEWNSIVLEAKPLIADLVARKMAPLVDAVPLPSFFNASLEGDIVHMCVERAYADIVLPGLYSHLIALYLAGHFPCGWSGTYPGGKLIVY